MHLDLRFHRFKARVPLGFHWKYRRDLIRSKRGEETKILSWFRIYSIWLFQGSGQTMQNLEMQTYQVPEFKSEEVLTTTLYQQFWEGEGMDLDVLRS
jgi:hypothetical protein